MRIVKISINFYWIAAVFFVLPIWLLPNWLTCDGACHTYNAAIISDLLKHPHNSFFSTFFEWNKLLVPNWFSHIFLGISQQFFTPSISEKILASFYVCLFVYSIYFFQKTFTIPNKYFAIVPLTFIYHFTVFAGFYNYAISIPLAILIFSLYYQWIQDFTRKRLFLFWLLSICLFFAHGFGILIASFACGGLFIFYSFQQKKINFSVFFQLVLYWIPSILLSFIFLKNTATAIIPSINPTQLLRELLQLVSTLIIRSDAEKKYTSLLFSGLSLLVFIAFIKKIKNIKLSIGDLFLVISLLFLLLYFYQPASIFDGSLSVERVQVLFFLFISLWLTTIHWGKLFSFMVFVFFIYINFNLYSERKTINEKYAETFAEIQTVEPFLAAKKIVLPVVLNNFGTTTDGKFISGRYLFFKHSLGYIGAEKQLILLDNYEANTTHFPLVWKAGFNPYTQLVASPEIMENEHPKTDIALYEKNIKSSIDYIAILFENENKMHPDMQNINENLAQNFTLIFTSKNKIIQLYKRK